MLDAITIIEEYKEGLYNARSGPEEKEKKIADTAFNKFRHELRKLWESNDLDYDKISLLFQETVQLEKRAFLLIAEITGDFTAFSKQLDELEPKMQEAKMQKPERKQHTLFKVHFDPSKLPSEEEFQRYLEMRDEMTRISSSGVPDAEEMKAFITHHHLNSGLAPQSLN